MHQFELSIAQVIKKLDYLGALYSRPMFGNYGIYCDNVAFAMLAEGSLYLRANKQLSSLFILHNMARFTYKNRGMPVKLHYYHVNLELWQNSPLFTMLTEQAWQAAKDDKMQKKDQQETRLKALPNITLSLERLLWRAGIVSPEKLASIGAPKAFLMIKKMTGNTNIEILYALAAAIEGCHVATLNEQVRSTLRHSVNSEIR